MADYYSLLKIRRDATQDEVKRAYRRLARELHPDVNPDPETQERFKEITQAYEVLSDTDKRRMYDMGVDPFASSRVLVRRDPRAYRGYGRGMPHVLGRGHRAGHPPADL